MRNKTKPKGAGRNLPTGTHKENQPQSDLDCKLGVHTASNQHSEKQHQFFWGYKSHVLVDCISGLPLYELTTPANVSDSTVTEEILAAASSTLPIRECTFLAASTIW